MRKILVTTDLSEDSFAAFPAAQEIASKFGSSITLLAVVEDPSRVAFAYAMELPVVPDHQLHQQRIERVKLELAALREKYFSGTPGGCQVIDAATPIATEIATCAAREAVDLIVISSHGRSGISRLLLGSVAERVMREATCPVLLVPIRRA
jgi:nucleotide-binding universal stress UspA family protein